MCSGDGQCVGPILQVNNELRDQGVEFEQHAKDCSSLSSSGDDVQAYDMYGASAWKTIPDILQMYGMCSYREWFEYLEFMDPTNAEKCKNQGACGIDSTFKSCDEENHECVVEVPGFVLMICPAWLRTDIYVLR
jgi:hypothetical protein